MDTFSCIPHAFLFVLAIICSATTQSVCHAGTLLANCSVSELEALIDFKNGLNDPKNRLTSWLGSNCCQWKGIRCDNITSAVISIDLHNPFPVISNDIFDPFPVGSDSTTVYWNLSGEVRPSLLKLESLKYLDLSYNTFGNTPLPEFIGSLQNLQYLNLSNCGFSGTIPSSLGNLSSLQYLDLSAAYSTLNVGTIQWMTGLVSLKHLAMDQVDLSLVGPNWLQVLNMLPDLTEMHLSYCALSGSISSLGLVNFTSLAVIDLSWNDVNSEFPNWLVNSSSLVYVDLRDCFLRGRIPLALGELPNLRYLNLSSTENLRASCLELLKGSWKQIEILNLSGNKLHGKLPASIGHMTSLTTLDLSWNVIGGGIPRAIGRLCNLRTLDLSNNNLTGKLPQTLKGIDTCFSISPLVRLRLHDNWLTGELPKWLGRFENIEELRLEFNLFEGPILVSLGTLKNLTELRLSGNKLNGTLPESFGQLSKLTILDVSSNHLTGFVSETHFSNLSNLKELILSSNSFVLNVSSNWVLPFQVYNLDMKSCQLGPSFPTWLQSQKKIQLLDISNASISDYIPSWFWDSSSSLEWLNISLNQIKGQLPNPLKVASFAVIDLSSNLFEGAIPLPSVPIGWLDLSKNRFSGPVPQNINEAMPYLFFLSLSNNQLTGEVPSSVGLMVALLLIDLSNNRLTGNIPSSLGNCSHITGIDLAFNNLSGVIPSSLGQLNRLQLLHLNHNMLSGDLPHSLRNLSSLETLDVGNNRISGNIPMWFGYGFASIRILRLRSNTFSGKIPGELSNLTTLQVLDVAENNLTGNIPTSLGNLKAIAQEQKTNQSLFDRSGGSLYYQESLVVNIKGQFQEFTKTLYLVTSLDLSGNNLNGEFPVELTKLFGLMVLNISRNQISGRIPETISSLHQLESLDLSNNKLSGSIPPSISALTFLSYLNVSNNNFSGAIPYTGQITTFNESSFGGNPGLCGAPLLVECRGEDSNKGKNVEKEINDRFVDEWFYLSVGLGFGAGLVVPYLIVAIRKPWAEAYFGLVVTIVHRLCNARSSRRAKFHRHQPHRQ